MFCTACTELLQHYAAHGCFISPLRQRRRIMCLAGVICCYPRFVTAAVRTWTIIYLSSDGSCLPLISLTMKSVISTVVCSAKHTVLAVSCRPVIIACCMCSPCTIYSEWMGLFWHHCKHGRSHPWAYASAVAANEEYCSLHHGLQPLCSVTRCTH
jgi:hypothetical protein